MRRRSADLRDPSSRQRRRCGDEESDAQCNQHCAHAARRWLARMGHDSERAAMIYQHEARCADKTITDAIDTHVEDEKRKNGDEGGATGTVERGCDSLGSRSVYRARRLYCL
jgi:hypothetical protein